MTDEAPLEPSLLECYEVADPPADLADRVLARLSAERGGQPVRHRRGPFWVGALAMTAAAALLLLRPTGRAASGEARVSSRTTLVLGRRGTAVAEAGATLRWRVADDGAADVNQSAGNVFYRVERGGRFTVRTPAGDVTVKGTCFRVEVGDMKSPFVAATLGAAAATTVLVSVYEGRVLFANEHGRAEVSAGSQAAAVVDRAPRAVDEPVSVPRTSALDTPAADMTRDELLRRDQVQRDAIARLSDQVKKLRAAGSDNDGADPGRRDKDIGREATYVDPPKEELLEWAKKCRLNWDTPSLESNKLSESDDLGLSAEEKATASSATEEFNARTLKELRALYTEVTGDARSAEVLSQAALENEIVNKSANHEQLQQLFQQLSAERVGLRPPVSDRKGASVAERYFRLVTGLGDQYERVLGGAIGPQRAHDLRVKNNGWGNRHGSSYGCPGEPSR